MGFFVSFFVALAFAVVGELLRPKQTPPNAKAAALDDFDIPTAEEGRSIPIICGKVKITGANVTWWGDIEITAIKKKVKTGWFSSATQVINNKYLIGMQMALCHGRPEGVTLHKINFGDDEPKSTKTDEGNGVLRVVFADDNFFGGNESEGGVSGTVRFYAGSQTQPENAYWEGIIGESAPAYHGLCYGMLEHLYIGTSHYLKPVSWEVSSYPNGLGMPSGQHIIGVDANPLCFIYEVLTNNIWGGTVLPLDIDAASFQAAALTVFNEGLGMSMIYNGSSTARDIIGEILRHIDGCIYSDPETGLITVKLARADYDVNTLPVYTKDDFHQGIKFSRPSWSETKNSIKGSFTNRAADYTVSMVAQKDLANVWVRGGEVAHEDLDFTAFTSEDACRKAVARALKTMAYPLANLEGELQRRAGWRLKPASVFKVYWPELGLDNVIFRVVKIDYGTLQSPGVSVQVIEDIFAVETVAYTPMPPSGWVDPVGAVQPLARQKMFELPFQFTGNGSGAYIGTLASRSGGIDLGYYVHSGLASGDVNLTLNADVQDFTPSALTTMPYPNTTAERDPGGFTVSDVRHGSDIPATVPEADLLAGDSIALIVSGAGEELCAFKNFTGSAVTDVIRGVYGTQKLNHPTGATVWFLSYGFGVEQPTPYTGFPKTVYGKFLPYNIKGALPIASATQMSVVLTGKATKPEAPTYLRVNGSTAPPTVTSTDAVVTWEWRNRDVQGGRIYVSGSGTDPLPVGSKYLMQIYAGVTLLRTYDNLTAPTATYLQSEQLLDGNGLKEARVSFVDAAGNSSPVSVISFNTNAAAVTSLLHFEGANGSTVVTDAVDAVVWTTIGNANISTAQFESGTSSLFTNTTGSISRPTSPTFNVGSNDFTIEAWVRPNAIGTTQNLFSNRPSGSGTPGITFRIDTAGRLNAFYGNGTAGITGTTAMVAGTWNHVSLCRVGTTWRLFLNGNLEVSGAVNANLSTGAFATTYLGCYGAQSSTTERFAGYIDEFRFTLGFGRYTANFTPPPGPLDTSI